MVFLVGFCFFRMENLALTSARTQMYWERRSTARVRQCCCINAVTFVFKIQFLAHFLFPAKFIIGRIWDRLLAIIRYIGKIWDGREKVKSPIVWDFPDMWKTGFIRFIGRIWDGRQKEKSPIVWEFSDIQKKQSLLQWVHFTHGGAIDLSSDYYYYYYYYYYYLLFFFILWHGQIRKNLSTPLKRMHLN